LLIQAWNEAGSVSGIRPALARWLPVDPLPRRENLDSGKREAREPAPTAALAKLEEPAVKVELSALMMDRTMAMRVLLRRWGVELGEIGDHDPCDRLETFGLRCEVGQGQWSDIRAFDRPALLRIESPGGEQGYAVVGRLDTETATFDLQEDSRRVALASLDKEWTGDFLMVWQPPPVGNSVIGPSSSRESVRWLRKLLSQVPGLGVNDNGSGAFDQNLEEAVRRFQAQQGLNADGVAGARTLIRLHNAVAMPGIPHLTAPP